MPWSGSPLALFLFNNYLSSVLIRNMKFFGTIWEFSYFAWLLPQIRDSQFSPINFADILWSSFYTISNQKISRRWPKYRPISIDLKFLRVWAEWVAENSSSLSEDSKSDSEAGKFLPNYGAGWHGRAASRIMLVVRDERLSCGLSTDLSPFPGIARLQSRQVAY